MCLLNFALDFRDYAPHRMARKSIVKVIYRHIYYQRKEVLSRSQILYKSHKLKLLPLQRYEGASRILGTDPGISLEFSY